MIVLSVLLISNKLYGIIKFLHTSLTDPAVELSVYGVSWTARFKYSWIRIKLIYNITVMAKLEWTPTYFTIYYQ